MNLKPVDKIAIGTAVFCILGASYFFLKGNYSDAGPFLLFFFLFTGIFFYRDKNLNGYTYTIMVMGAATLAMYYPGPFISFKDYNLSQLITPLIQFIMFGMGTAMSIKDFVAVAKMPKGVITGLACQLTIMPLSGFTLAYFSGLPPEIAAGIVLVGCSPSGVASNVISFLAKANLALSISITALSTLLAPFTTPLLMKWLAGSLIEIQIWDMMWNIFKMVIIPIGAGLLVNKLLKDRAGWIRQIMPTASMVVVAVVIVLITAAGRDHLLEIGGLLLLLVLIHNTVGYLLGFGMGRMLGLGEKDARTIALEVGLQNGGMAGALAREMGKIATLGLAPAIFSVLMNITGSVLASFWHERPPKS
ncbi:MAG: bile acid:sodium symporter family protein [Cyclobacteriaceae bacterium]